MMWMLMETHIGWECDASTARKSIRLAAEGLFSLSLPSHFIESDSLYSPWIN